MKKYKQLSALFLVLALLFAVACTPNNITSVSTEESNEDANSSDVGENVSEDSEYSIDAIEGHNMITFYWGGKDDAESCDVWVWWDGKDGSGYLLYDCAYGKKAMINVPENITQVGFIVRYDCSEPGGTAWGTATKDYEEDRFALITGSETVIYLKSGDASQYTSTDGGKTLEIIKKLTLAGMVDFNKIQYNVTPKTKITSLEQVKVFEGKREIAVTDLTSLNNEVVGGTITVAEKLDISKTYTLKIEGFAERPIVPTTVFDSETFLSEYTYDGDDLGAVIDGDSTVFKVWAPTASKVTLNIYPAGNDCEASENIDMVKGEKGVWSHKQTNCGHGTYYDYTVTTSVGTQNATDPYAKAAGVNGDRSMVVDFSITNPENWEESSPIELKKYTDAIIWEVHVRDFSNKISDSQYKGKYLAFTEHGLKNSSGHAVGVDYLKELGITHVHLLPVYDYATVDERNPDEQFNWGYDPKNYNVLEGSYSTDPYNGDVRIKEFKQMVQSMHADGLGVIMDVVYNHTYDANSAFNRIVPYYYYRYTSTGANSSASGCGNDTASERYMYRKFMVDSVSFWAREYNLDGFRFDLMGLHDLETMRCIEQAVHAINPSAIIYGEGWTMGSTIDGSAQANQSNISKIEPSEGAAGGIAVFNDAIRDGLKGSVFQKDSKGYISGNYKNTQVNVLFGIKGGVGAGPGWTVKNNGVINYMSAHDNHTLWDKLSISCPEADEETKAKMNALGAAILFTSRGTVFMQAGEEMLRTKGGDENSYKSSDDVNNIDWEALKDGSLQLKMMEYYKALIAIRKKTPILTASGVAITNTSLSAGGMVVEYDNHMGSKLLVLLNPTDKTDSFTPNGNWTIIGETTDSVTGSIEIPSYSAIIISSN